MKTIASVSVLVKQAGSAAAERLHQGLRDAGARVVVVPTAYDVVAHAEGAAGAVGHVLLGVDHVGAGELRLIPLVRREWPETVVVAYHSPGFEHKGRIAELVGADIVLSTADDASRFLASLTSCQAAQPAVATSVPPTSPRAAEPAAPPRPTLPPSVAAPAAPPLAPATEPEPPQPASDTTPPEPAGEAPVLSAAAPAVPPAAPAAEPEPSGEPQAADVAAPSTPPVVESYFASAVKPENAPAPTGEPPAADVAALSTPAETESYLAGAVKTGTTPQSQHELQSETEGLPGDAEILDGDQEPAGGGGLGTVELTDEELRILLGEEGET